MQLTKYKLNCSHCGDDNNTVSIYLQYDASKKMQEGFYPDLSVRLCEKCLQEALGVLNEAWLMA